MKKEYDVVIIGYGPAGISASLYIQRAGLRAAVIGKDYGALSKAESIENYFGLPQSLSGSQLAENGIAQAKALGADVIKAEVFGITWNGGYCVSCSNGEYFSDAVIIATGSSRESVDIPGVKEFEGRGVSYCAVCDAFFYRGKDVAVLGNTLYAAHEIAELMQVVGSVTLLTDGKELLADIPGEVRVIETKLRSLYGGEKLEGVELDNGERLDFSGLFIALGSAAASDLARKTGAQLNGSSIVVDENMFAGVPGLYAAGDCTGGVMQVSVAVGEGAKAAMSAIKFVKAQKRGK